jgi:hypothetical protein
MMSEETNEKKPFENPCTKATVLGAIAVGAAYGLWCGGCALLPHGGVAFSPLIDELITPIGSTLVGVGSWYFTSKIGLPKEPRKRTLVKAVAFGLTSGLVSAGLIFVGMGSQKRAELFQPDNAITTPERPAPTTPTPPAMMLNAQ